MPRRTLLLTLLALALGCGSNRLPQDVHPSVLLDAQTMRIDPVFTRFADWNKDGSTDGVDAFVMFYDRFQDPVKAQGSVMLELYEYQPNDPRLLGNRVGGPWNWTLQAEDDQRNSWNRTLRAYHFKLAQSGIRKGQLYILTCTFQSARAARFYGRFELVQP